MTLDEELKKDGYDGLYCPEGNCACELGDLHPCGEYTEECKPGYKKTYDQLTEDQKKYLDSDCDVFIIANK